MYELFYTIINDIICNKLLLYHLRYQGPPLEAAELLDDFLNRQLDFAPRLNCTNPGPRGRLTNLERPLQPFMRWV